MLTPRQTLATFLRVVIMHAPGAVQKITADDLRGALIDLLLDCDAAAGVSNSDSAQPSAESHPDCRNLGNLPFNTRDCDTCEHNGECFVRVFKCKGYERRTESLPHGPDCKCPLCINQSEM